MPPLLLFVSFEKLRRYFYVWILKRKIFFEFALIPTTFPQRELNGSFKCFLSVTRSVWNDFLFILEKIGGSNLVWRNLCPFKFIRYHSGKKGLICFRLRPIFIILKPTTYTNLLLNSYYALFEYTNWELLLN